MTVKVRIGLVAVALLVGTADHGVAQRQTQPQRQAQAQPEFDRIFRSVLPQPDARAQQQKKQQAKQPARQRAPTRITVRPVLRYRHDATEFPRTDNLGFPGRNAVRQCRSWLATEHRMSGTVVTPQMRCWWQAG